MFQRALSDYFEEPHLVVRMGDGMWVAREKGGKKSAMLL